jgi:hypothetical protein
VVGRGQCQCQFDTDHSFTCSEGGQAQEALLPAAPDAHDHHVTLMHTQHSVNSGEVLQSIIKEHQIQPAVPLVVLLQNLRESRMTFSLLLFGL